MIEYSAQDREELATLRWYAPRDTLLRFLDESRSLFESASSFDILETRMDARLAIARSIFESAPYEEQESFDHDYFRIMGILVRMKAQKCMTLRQQCMVEQ